MPSPILCAIFFALLHCLNQNVFNFVEITYLFFILLICCSTIFKNLLLDTRSQRCNSWISSKSFINLTAAYL